MCICNFLNGSDEVPWSALERRTHHVLRNAFSLGLPLAGGACSCSSTKSWIQTVLILSGVLRLVAAQCRGLNSHNHSLKYHKSLTAGAANGERADIIFLYRGTTDIYPLLRELLAKRQRQHVTIITTIYTNVTIFFSLQDLYHPTFVRARNWYSL